MTTLKAKSNNKNNFSKRNANTVSSILKSIGAEFDTCENLGDGRSFCILNNKMTNRMRLKRAGFILERSNGNKVLNFRCF